MKRFLGSRGILAVLVFVAVFFPFPRTSWCAPGALAQDASFDAGEVAQGRDLEHEFLLKNVGDEPLTFTIESC